MSDDTNDAVMHKATWLEQAQWFVSYYERVAANEGSAWLLGLFMAKQWLRLLPQPQRDIEELHLFVKVLEAERLNQGSGWSDMYFRARKWVEEVESQD